MPKPGNTAERITEPGREPVLTDQPTNRSTIHQPTSQHTDRPIERPTGQPADRLPRGPTDRPTDRPKEPTEYVLSHQDRFRFLTLPPSHD